MDNEKLVTLKSNLIDFASFFYQRDNKYDVDYLMNNFLFDSITEMQEMHKMDEEQEKLFKDYQSEDKAAEVFIQNSLECFFAKFQESRADEPYVYTIQAKNVNSLENIFLGLKYESNNDTDYKNAPSALALATFTVK